MTIKSIKNKLGFILLVFFIALFGQFSAFAMENDDFLYDDIDEYQDGYYMLEEESFYRARILKIERGETEIFDNYIREKQTIEVEIIGGERKGEVIKISHDRISDLGDSQEFKEKDRVILFGYTDSLGEEIFFINDHDRSHGLIFVIAVFLITVLYFGRKRGLGAVMGLVFSALILIYYIVPSIVSGNNPFQVTIIGSILIASVSLFLAHGINKRTPIIWLSTVCTLVLAILIAFLFVEFTRLFGRGSDVNLFFQMGDYSYINLKGLLLAGIIISVLGILNDVTSTQTTAVWELKKANPGFKFKDLYGRGINIGREHIASLVNTLILVYVGASLPIFILLTVVEDMPLWVKLNNEPIAEEIVRTMVGSISLILAVPISTALATYFIEKMKK